MEVVAFFIAMFPLLGVGVAVVVLVVVVMQRIRDKKKEDFEDRPF